MNELIEFLRQTKLFSLLAADEISKVVSYLSRIETESETILFSEGDCGEELLIISSGEVESYVKLANKNMRTVARFHKGDFFGEMAMFEDAPRSATCATKTPAVLYKLEKKAFFSLMAAYPLIANRIMFSMLTEITDRLHEKSSFLTDMVTWGETARRRSITDEVTGIYNRRFFDESLKEAIISTEDTGVPFFLIMIDIDHFKNVNLILPDNMVNMILKEITGAIKRNLDDRDILARYGGDEFTVLVPGKNRSQIIELAVSMGSAVRNTDYYSLTGIKDMIVTISQGIASYPDDAADSESLVRQADKALYRAKHEGRNRAICAFQMNRDLS